MPNRRSPTDVREVGALFARFEARASICDWLLAIGYWLLAARGESRLRLRRHRNHFSTAPGNATNLTLPKMSSTPAAPPRMRVSTALYRA